MINLVTKANWVRRQVLKIAFETGKGHIGGTFSCTDLLVALYYGNILRIDAKHPRWSGRDRLVIGKGHACLAVYNILVDLGFIDESRLQEYGEDGSSLSGQLNIDTPGVEYNSGSLGHALGVGAGMALAAKMDGMNYRAFALLGDGECEEGSIWESAMFAGQNSLDNFIGIVDRNRLSVTGLVDKEKSRLEERFSACGWDVNVIDGHSFKAILGALSDLDRLNGPYMVLADTVKGKGVSFMEDGVKWHHSIPTKEEYEVAIRELTYGDRY